ncbi:hypothetical protein LNV23_15595 [Paucibacter sp. DJ1R-11]|uniref:hypothetical protein n=1 Tax=Paucibacter sp. DJ1R-11 TaxID=2893556 RepID=UPI0021E484BA|nr:hypothetical protein [Paucibacter sp. DJ1R-11]MCV2364874.1 hypothetical protein [Paucibacter sp. DJ1R-11]
MPLPEFDATAFRSSRALRRAMKAAWRRADGEHSGARLLGQFLLGLLLCVLPVWWLGLWGALFSATALTYLLLPALLSGLAELWAWAAPARWADVQGQRYSFMGAYLHIERDLDGQPWLSCEEVRRAGVDLPESWIVQARLDPARCRMDASGRRLQLRADALLAGLQGTAQPRGHKFALWLQRVVIYPADRAARRR